jgi:hypothetical protein
MRGWVADALEAASAEVEPSPLSAAPRLGFGVAREPQPGTARCRIVQAEGLLAQRGIGRIAAAYLLLQASINRLRCGKDSGLPATCLPQGCCTSHTHEWS